MSSTRAYEKPMSEKQRLKLEKFKQKQESLAKQPQQTLDKKARRLAAPTVSAKDWIEETPAGHRKILKPLDDDFHKAYLPSVVESAWYSYWETQGLFKPRTEEDGSLKPKGKYVIAMPPPNVTGKLHIGHALALSLEDTLIRWHRMRQFSTLFIPGCDHAGIATQAVIEKQLAKNPINGKSKRQEFSREEFVQLCQDWKEDYQQNINNAARRLGISPDWSREAFTMSPQLSKAVTETFVQLHEEGFIYRANKLVHWSCRLSTALSNLEVDQKEIEGTTKLDVPGYDRKVEFGTLTYFKYQIEDSDQTIEVATTRPETMLGDTGIAVHPQDDRYTDFVGKTAIHPIIPGRKLKIIADEYVEREFGTGAVKLTPAHDYNDFNLGKKHGLPFINILNEDGTLNGNAGPYAGEKRFNARYRVIEELKSLGLYTKSEPNKMTVPICSRSGDVVEPLLKPQWWMKMESLTKPAIEVVESGELVIRPEVQRRSYLQWMRNLQDWCLSRQLWWGHQIPAYFVSFEGEDAGDDADDRYWVCGRTEREAQEKAEQRFPGKKLTLRRDEDVLDTWFSSGLWPFSTLGWPDKTEDLDKYFPNSTLETGWDIIPFWVSRMIMFSLKLTGKVPFTEVYCHGLIRDSEGRKMSKSLGNVVDPIDIIDGISLEGLHQKLRQGNLAQGEIKNAERYQKKAFPQGIPDIGADALRFSLVNYTQSSGGDINFDIKTMHGYRKFCNKIYQATKYVLGKLGDDFVPRESSALTGRESLPERWILTKMNNAAKQINQELEAREFSKSARISHQFLYDELFDIFIENSKSIISDGTPEEARSAMDTLYTALETGLRLVSPFMPFLTEELWQRLPRRPGDDTCSISIAEYPEFEESFHDPRSEVAYELVLGCSRGFRVLLAEYAVKDNAIAYILPLTQATHETASAQISAIKSLSSRTPIDISILPVGSATPAGCAVFPVSAEANVYLEVKDRIQDAGKEVEKFRAKLAEARRDQENNDAHKADLNKLQDVDAAEARQLVERRTLDIEARLRALEEMVAMFQETAV
ncbi:tRNA synthetases class I domain-containing protein [Trichoderma austrokoningii]